MQELLTLPQKIIQEKIYYIRGEKVIFDRDLATLYGVETKALNQAVKRNATRFPEDFMFKLNEKEMQIWKSQIVTSSGDVKGLRKPLSVFTEQGVAMLSSILKSERAVQVNIQIMRTFTQIRKMLISHKDLREKLEVMEKKYDKKFRVVFETLGMLLKEDEKPAKRIGFGG